MMRIIELFGGIGACTQALKRLKLDIEIVDYVEIDKYAVKSYNAINGTNFEPQDITEWNKNFENIDLIMHGSPCQDFSIAGKQAGGDLQSGTRSSLMYETLRIVEKIKPKYVIWENVKNILSKKHRHNFDNYLDKMQELGYTNYYEVLNAKDYGIPQNRERVFTVSIRNDCVLKGTYNNGVDDNDLEPYFKFPKKEELKLRLKDILEDEVEEKYYLKDYQIENIKKSNYITNQRRIQEKDYCDTLCARDWKDPKCVRVAGIFDTESSKHQAGSIYDSEKIAPPLDTMQGGYRQPMVIIDNEPQIMKYDIVQQVVVRKHPVDIEKLKECLRNAKEKSNLSNAKIATLLEEPQTKVEHWFRTDSCFSVPEPSIWLRLKNLLNIITSEFDESIMTFEEREGIYEKSNRCYFIEGISPTLTVTSANEKIITNFRIRKLTPKECWRLMGFDDESFEKARSAGISNTQLYKQAGNSIVVSVLEKILKELIYDNI